MLFSCNWMSASMTQHSVVSEMNKEEEIQLLQAKFYSQVNPCTF